MKKHLVFIGAPGSGKGTQSAKFKEEMGYKHVSTGDLLRAEIAKKSELGMRVKSVMESGQLVSDDLVVELLKANINLRDNYYIFDGYPRNIAQVKTLDEKILSNFNYLAIYFKLDTDKLVERITNRRVSPDGKHIYNLKTNPPKVAGICDVTGEKLVHRDDDKEDVIRERMKVFESTLNPMLDFYKTKGILAEVDADKGVDEVFKEISGLI